MKRGITLSFWAAFMLLVVYFTVEGASWLNFHVSGGVSPEFPRALKISLMAVMAALAVGRFFYVRSKILRLEKEEPPNSKG
jgi:hypothetical protein